MKRGPGHDRTVRRAARVCALAALGLALAAMGAKPGRCAEPQRPNLQGSWVFNSQLTASLAKDQQADSTSTDDALGGHKHSGASPRGPQGDMDIGSGTGAKVKPDDDDKKVLRSVYEQLDTLTIAQQPGQVAITDHTGHTRLLKTDGSKVHDPNGPGGGADLHAGWNRDNDLEVQVKPEKGGKHTEQYAVSHDGKHLYITFINTRFERTIRAYDAAPPAPTAAVAPPAPPASIGAAPPPAAQAPAAPPPAAPPPAVR